MSTKNQENEVVKLSAAEIAKHQEIAQQELNRVEKQIDLNQTESAALFPYGGSFSVTGIGYILVTSVTPMEFTNGVKLSFKGEGGGAAVGSAVFAGGGIFNMDPATLPGKEFTFLVAAGSGVPAPVTITFFYNHRPIGSFSGVGLSAFIGAGGGVGHFTRL